MADQVLQFVLKATNTASPEFAKIAKELEGVGAVVRRLGPDFANLAKQIDLRGAGARAADDLKKLQDAFKKGLIGQDVLGPATAALKQIQAEAARAGVAATGLGKNFGDLKAPVAGLTSGFQDLVSKGLAPLASISPGLASSLGGLLTKLGPAGAAGVGAVAIAIGGFTTAAVGALTETAKLADEIGKLSIKTGASVESLSALKLAAELSDTTIQDVATGIKFMQNALDGATQGNDQAIDSFRRLGISLDEIKRLSPEKQFELLATKITEVEDPTKKLALAQDTFGRGVQDLLPLLADLKERGLKGVIEEGKRLGVVFSDDLAKKAQDYNDELKHLSAVAQGTQIQLGSGLLPLALDLAKGTLNVTTATRELAATYGGTLSKVLLALIPELQFVVALYERLTGGAAAATPPTDALGGSIKKVGEAATLTADQLRKLPDALTTALTAVQGLGKGFEDIVQKLQLQQFADQTGKALEALELRFKAGKLTVEEYDRISKGLTDRLAEANSRGFAPAAEGSAKLAEQTKVLTEAQTIAASAIERVAIAGGAYSKTLGETVVLTNNYEASVTALTGTYTQLATATGAAATSLQSLKTAEIDAAKGELWQKFLEGRLSVDQLHAGIQALNAALESLGKEKLPATTEAATKTTEAFQTTDTAVRAVGDSIAATLFNVGAASEETIRILDELIAKGKAAQAAASGGAGATRGGTGQITGAITGQGITGDIVLDSTVLGSIISQKDNPPGSGLTPFSGPSQFDPTTKTGPAAGAPGSTGGGIFAPSGYPTPPPVFSPYTDTGTYQHGGQVPIIAHRGELVGQPDTLVTAFMEALRRMDRGRSWSMDRGERGGLHLTIERGAVNFHAPFSVAAERDMATVTEILAQRLEARLARR